MFLAFQFADRTSLGATQRAGAVGEGTVVHRRLPGMMGLQGALPPDEPLGSGREMLRAEASILRRMPFRQQMRMSDRNGILPAVTCLGRPMKAADTERTVASLPIIHRGIPHVMGIGRTLPPDPLARMVGDVIGREGAVLGGMPGGGELRGFPAQCACVKGFVVARSPGEGTSAAAGALAIARLDGCAPDMLRMLMTLPPYRLGTIGRALVEREGSVLRRMPLAGEIRASDAEGRRCASLPTASGSSMRSRSSTHRGGPCGPHHSITVRPCLTFLQGCRRVISGPPSRFCLSDCCVRHTPESFRSDVVSKSIR